MNIRPLRNVVANRRKTHQDEPFHVKRVQTCSAGSKRVWAHFTKNLLIAGFCLFGLVAHSQTAFPGPNENVWLVADKLLYGTVPAQAMGTNSPGTAGYVLLTDGAHMYWGPVGAGGTTTNLTVQNFNVNVVSNYQNITFATNVVFNNNVTVNSNLTVNVVNVTNQTVYDSLTVNTNVTVNQNFTVSGKATFNNITVTNQLAFTTNAFPLSAGTTWNLTKPYQRILTNADFAIGALGGLTNNTVNWGVLWWSNSDSATHFCDMTALSVTPQGPNSTNKLYVASGKTATISIASWGVGQETNLVTALGQ